MVSWTLNGLDVVAQNAVVSTSEDGLAHNTFWLTDRQGACGAARWGCREVAGPCGRWPQCNSGSRRAAGRRLLCSLAVARPAGRKLSDSAAELLAERVRDFVT